MEADRRYVLLDSQERVRDYCSPYHRRLHIEVGERDNFKGGAWVPYYDYLLKNPKGWRTTVATTNEKSHRPSVGEFMNLGVVEKWISFEDKSSGWQPKHDWT
ncbi:hypothetical protein SELMODRAFT_427874 [Selaginella moellendorffii]|nr:hypothetical protein SELMODRAFT_427874 [Selaginella moellendorffii]